MKRQALIPPGNQETAETVERPPKFLVDIFNPIPIRESDYAHCILNNFAEYLTPMLTLGPCSSANLVLDLKMRENLESNLPVCVWGGGQNSL